MKKNKLKIKDKDKLIGFAGVEDLEYANKVYNELLEEMKKTESELLKKTGNKRDSQFCYSLGKYISEILKKYDYDVEDRIKFIKALRENVNTSDNRVVRTMNRDVYEYSYQLSKLNEKLALKYSWSKWVYFFDIVTARQDERIFRYLESDNSNILTTSNGIFQNFLKGVKVYYKYIDYRFINDDEIIKVYEKIKKISVEINLKKKHKKISSNDRDEIFFNELIKNKEK